MWRWIASSLTFLAMTSKADATTDCLQAGIAEPERYLLSIFLGWEKEMPEQVGHDKLAVD
jgi:hypothetical protein